MVLFDIIKMKIQELQVSFLMELSLCRIYDLCMSDNPTSFLEIEQQLQFPHLQQWLGLSVAGAVELGHIAESPVIRAATSIAPLGWNGVPDEKNGDLLKVDITGLRLHLCTLVHAQVNGNWYCLFSL